MRGGCDGRHKYAGDRSLNLWEPGAVMRILVVDDFGPWRSYIRSLLAERPKLEIVSEAVNGSEAVQKAEELQPDLILMDVTLPRMNGLEAAERIRKVSPNSKMLFVSVESATEIMEAARRVGAQGFIPKAEARSKLLPAIEALNSNHR